jgi:hypothetical protein
MQAFRSVVLPTVRPGLDSGDACSGGFARRFTSLSTK